MTDGKTLKQVWRMLTAALPEGAVVLRPDHPLMLDGPDILAGYEGSMLCLFKERRGEGTFYRDARMMASRLCIPKAVCVLLDDESEFYDLAVPSGNNALADLLMEAGQRETEANTNWIAGDLSELIAESERSRKANPYGGAWALSEESIHDLPCRIIRVSHDAASWLEAVRSANCFEEKMVVPAEEPPLVAIADWWPRDANKAIRSYCSTGIMLLSPDREHELVEAVHRAYPLLANEAGTPKL